MNIKINEYTIKSDPHCFIVHRNTKIKGKDGKIKPKKVLVGYYSTMQSLFKCLPERMLMNSDCTSLNEIHKLWYDYNNMIKKELGEYLDGKRN